MVHARKEILRQYYESAFGKNGPGSRAFAGATFDEYYELRKINDPDISRWNAAIRSKDEDFRRLAETFEPDPPVKDRVLGGGERIVCQKPLVYRRCTLVDLARETIDDDVDSILFDRVKTIAGLERLAQLKKLVQLQFILSGTPECVFLDNTVELDTLTVHECTSTCMTSVVRSTNSRNVRIRHFHSPGVNLELLNGHTRLQELLYIVAPLVRTSQSPLPHPSRLLLSNVVMDDQFRHALLGCRKTLTELWLENDKPFPPEEMPNLSPFRVLHKIKVPGYPQFRKEWIDYALAHSEIGFEFCAVKEPLSTLPMVEITAIYRTVEILEVRKGKKISFEVAGNLAGNLRQSNFLSNHDVRDFIESAAKAARKRIDLDSSSDEIIIRSPKAETLRWCIDQIADHFPSEEKKPK